MPGDEDSQQKLRQLAEYQQKVAQLEAELRLDQPEEARERDARLAAERVTSTANLARAIAHEINNPLATCQGYMRRAVQLAEQLDDADELLDILRRLQRGAQRIKSVVGELQLLSDEIVGENEKLELSEVVERVGTLVPPELRGHLRFELDPVRVNLDRPRLYQLVYNMVMPFALAAHRDASNTVLVRCGPDAARGAQVEVSGEALPFSGTRTDLLAAIRGEYPSSTLPLRLARSLALQVGGQWNEGSTENGRYRSAVSLPRA